MGEHASATVATACPSARVPVVVRDRREGATVRVRIDEARVAELLAERDPSPVAR